MKKQLSYGQEINIFCYAKKVSETNEEMIPEEAIAEEMIQEEMIQEEMLFPEMIPEMKEEEETMSKRSFIPSHFRPTRTNFKPLRY